MAFVSIKKALETVLKEYNLKEDLNIYRVFYHWSEIVGEKIGDHTKPNRIKNGILYIEVDDPLWLTQLKYMKEEMVEKFEKMVEKGSLKDIKFYLKRV
ncbi:MAG: DUF721 domain-containing protein [Syntrophorhabdaceae bacterium]|nr:DUF721 domain-containing protein [Syntrophorhabdaceae bacterium]